MTPSQPDWIREKIAETVAQTPQLKAGVVHCKLCHNEIKIDAVEAMTTGALEVAPLQSYFTKSF